MQRGAPARPRRNRRPSLWHCQVGGPPDTLAFVPITETADLVRLARAATRDLFAKQAPRFVLVGPRTRAFEIAFRTDDVPFQPGKVMPRDFHLYAIAKSAGNPYAERISVGRARNCDVALRHSSVSKLHAHFRVEDSSVLLIDNNSRNGTRVDDRVLTPELRERVGSGSRIAFGSFGTLLLDAFALFDFLHGGVKTTGGG